MVVPYNPTTYLALSRPTFDEVNWHDYMNDNMYRIDAAFGAALIADEFPAWAVSTVYAVGDFAYDVLTFETYQCLVAHTAAGATFAAARAANPTYWQLAPFVTLTGAQTLTNKTLTAPVMTGVVLFGTSTNVTTAPPLAFTGDTNTGFGHSAADTLDFVTAGVDRVQITSAGVVSLLTGQLKMPASPNLSADPSTFDAYLEATYVPAWNGSSVNPSLGDGTLVGEYRRLAGFVSNRITLTIGSTTTFGTGVWIFSLPITALNSFTCTGQGVYASDASTGNLRGGTTFVWSTTAIAVFNPVDSAAWLSTVPFTWATGDILNTMISYHV